MVCLAEKPSLREASICKVEVANGANGLRFTAFFSTATTRNSPFSIAALMAAASAPVLMSSFLSVVPSIALSRAGNSSPLAVAITASMVQYSSVLKASISASRSHTRRKATDWTRPAERAPGSLRHSTGDSVKPTR